MPRPTASAALLRLASSFAAVAVAVGVPAPAAAQGQRYEGLPEGAVLLRQGLSADGRRALATEAVGGRCWSLRAFARTAGEDVWRAEGEAAGPPAAGRGGACPPVTAAASADRSAAVVYEYPRQRAAAFALAGDQPVAAGEVRLGGEASYENPPPAGAAFAPDGGHLLLGAPHLACKVGVPRQRCGLAALFRREPGGAFREAARFGFPEGGPFNIVFGEAVAVSSGAQVIAIGGSGYVGDQGEVYLYERQGAGWGEVGVLVPDARSDAVFGTDVALSADGRLAAVGAERAVYLFVRDARGWSQAERIDRPDQLAGSFGASVALSGDGRRLLVGAPRTSCGGGLLRCGTAYLYERAGGGNGSWSRVLDLAPPEPRPYIDFGWRVALDAGGRTAAVQGDRPWVIALP